MEVHVLPKALTTRRIFDSVTVHTFLDQSALCKVLAAVPVVCAALSFCLECPSCQDTPRSSEAKLEGAHLPRSPATGASKRFIGPSMSPLSSPLVRPATSTARERERHAKAEPSEFFRLLAARRPAAVTIEPGGWVSELNLHSSFGTRVHRARCSVVTKVVDTLCVMFYVYMIRSCNTTVSSSSTSISSLQP